MSWNCLKSLDFSFSKNLNFVCQYIRMENSDYKNENIERKYLKYMQKKAIFEGK